METSISSSSTSSEGGMVTLADLIRQAIDEGAPMYNEGRKKECYDLYSNAVQIALSEPIIAESMVGQMLKSAAEEATAVVVSVAGDDDHGNDAYAESAWILRHCFDDILAREGDRSLTLVPMEGGEEDMGTMRMSERSNDDKWQDSTKEENKTDFDRGQAMADVCYILIASVTPAEHKRMGKAYRDCFEASEAVETLVGLGLGIDRSNAAAKCSLLVRAGLVLPVSHPDEKGEFKDGTHLYRFAERREIRTTLYDLLLDDEAKEEGNEKHVFAVALQGVLEAPGSGGSSLEESSATFAGVSMKSLMQPRSRRDVLAGTKHYARGVKLAEFAEKVESLVEIEDRTYHLKTYERCFVGKDAVTKLVSEGVAYSREDATERLSELERVGLIYHVTADHGFRDKFYFYRFPSAVTIKRGLDVASERLMEQKSAREINPRAESRRDGGGKDDDDDDKGDDEETNAVRVAALGYRYKRLTGLDVATILNDFYGCDDESGWDVSDLEKWRTDMKRWGFGRREDQDDGMVERLSPLVLNVDPNEWDKTDDDEWESPWGILAQIAIFDQIPRSAFRGTPDAFKWDELAIRATKRALEKGYFETAYRSTLNQFVLLLPLEHSESWEDQKLGVTLLLRMLSTVSVEDEGYSDYEIVKRLEFSKRLTTAFLEHAQVIAKFKKFPHRNRAQGRTTTLEERVWLASDLVPRWAKSQNPEGEGASKNIVKTPVIPLKRLTRGR